MACRLILSYNYVLHHTRARRLLTVNRTQLCTLRIDEKYKELDSADLIYAWKSAIAFAPRLDGSGSWIAIGLDF